MKKLFTLLLAATLFVACNNTKTENVEVASEMNKVELLVINSTDQIVSITATYGIDTPSQVWTINPGDSATVASNCSWDPTKGTVEACTEFQAQLLPPADAVKGNPSTGKFSLAYQLEPPTPDHILKCTDWDLYGSPMESTIYSADTDWKYTLTWGSDPANQTGWPIKNTVEIKSVTCITTAVTGGTGFECK
jgi:hypothetical protein